MATNIDLFRDAKWGVMIHYLAERYFDDTKEATAEQWNEMVDSVNVGRLAEQLASVGAAYCMVTLGQNSGYFCTPNATYDSIVGIDPSKCSQRDLVNDLYEVFQPRGIKLMVYCPNSAPTNDPVAKEKLQWEWGCAEDWTEEWNSLDDKRTGNRLVEFQKMWESIIREWSLRWGEKIFGWWFDGCYFADEMYRHDDAPNFKSFAEAIKAGNSKSLVAFNPGANFPVIRLTEYEDYTAGEVNRALPVSDGYFPAGRWVNGAQYHVMSFLGEKWGEGKPRFPDELVMGFTKHITDREGVITWDVPVSSGGHIPEIFLKQLALIKNSL